MRGFVYLLVGLGFCGFVACWVRDSDPQRKSCVSQNESRSKVVGFVKLLCVGSGIEKENREEEIVETRSTRRVFLLY